MGGRTEKDNKTLTAKSEKPNPVVDVVDAGDPAADGKAERLLVVLVYTEYK